MKKWTLAVAMLALGAVACGDDDSGDDGNNNGNNNGDNNGGTSGNNNGTTGGNNGNSTGGSDGGANGGAYPDCPREQIPDEWDKYDGDLTMTQTGFMACQDMCGSDEACYTEANCPGLTLFDDCLNVNLIACTASTGGDCRSEYENLLCCSVEKNCEGDAGSSCLEDNCPVDLKATRDCVDMDMDCLQMAAVSCLVAGRVLPPQSERRAVQTLLQSRVPLHSLKLRR